MRFVQAFAVSQVLVAGLVLGKPLDKKSVKADCITTTTTTSSSTSTKSSITTTTSTISSKSSSSSSLTPSSSSSTSISLTSSSSSSLSSSLTSSSSSSLSTTSTSTAAAVTPNYVQTVGSYSYAGCVAEPFFNGVSGVRALTGNNTQSTSMTVESCASFCSGYTYFGVEYSIQCYCGNSFSNGTTLDSSISDCSAVCAGNASEYCGGSSHLNVYQISGGSVSSLPTTYIVTATATATGSGSSGSTTTSTVTGTLSAVATASGYSFVACAVEPFENGISTRTLSANATSNSTSMTVEYCANWCTGYSYFGVEYASQCYCGNSIANGTTLDTTGGCNMACAGNSLEECGGSGRLNLYEVSSLTVVTLPITYVLPTSTSSSSTAVSTAVSISTSSSSTAVSTAVSTTSSSSSRTITSISSTASSSVTAASSSKSTTSTTSTTSSTATPTATFNVSSCTAITDNLGVWGTYKFDLYAQTTGMIENSNNPGNSWSWLLPPITLEICGTQTACQAAQSCINEIGFLGAVYKSFDLHYRTDTSAWECILYAGANASPSYFNVAESYVSNAYGFSGVAC